MADPNVVVLARALAAAAYTVTQAPNYYSNLKAILPIYDGQVTQIATLTSQLAACQAALAARPECPNEVSTPTARYCALAAQAVLELRQAGDAQVARLAAAGAAVMAPETERLRRAVAGARLPAYSG